MTLSCPIKPCRSVLFYTKKEGYIIIYEHILYIITYVYTCLYRVSGDPQKIFCERVEHVKLEKVLYYFAKFAIVNELLTIEDRHISARGRIGLL